MRYDNSVICLQVVRLTRVYLYMRVRANFVQIYFCFAYFSGNFSPRVAKHVRFSLSASHPPPDVEAEFGGRSNSQRLQDMARRRGYLLNREGGSADSLSPEGAGSGGGGGAFDRLVAIFWPPEPLPPRPPRRGRRHLGRLLLDAVTFVICLFALLVFSLIFLSLVLCVPLTLFTATDPVSSASAGSLLVGTCVRVLNIFGLQVLLAV